MREQPSVQEESPNENEDEFYCSTWSCANDTFESMGTMAAKSWVMRIKQLDGNIGNMLWLKWWTMCTIVSKCERVHITRYIHTTNTIKSSMRYSSAIQVSSFMESLVTDPMIPTIITLHRLWTVKFEVKNTKNLHSIIPKTRRI